MLGIDWGALGAWAGAVGTFLAIVGSVVVVRWQDRRQWERDSEKRQEDARTYLLVAHLICEGVCNRFAEIANSTGVSNNPEGWIKLNRLGDNLSVVLDRLADIDLKTLTPEGILSVVSFRAEMDTALAGLRPRGWAEKLVPPDNGKAYAAILATAKTHVKRLGELAAEAAKKNPA